MELSAETDMICFSSGVHFNLVTGAECPSPFPRKVNWRPLNEYTNTSLVSVPNASERPDGLISIVQTLYGYGMFATGYYTSQSQKNIGDP